MSIKWLHFRSRGQAYRVVLGSAATVTALTAPPCWVERRWRQGSRVGCSWVAATWHLPQVRGSQRQGAECSRGQRNTWVETEGTLLLSSLADSQTLCSATWCLQGQVSRTAGSPVQVRTLQQTLKLSVVSFGSLCTEDADNTFSFLFLLIWEEFLRVST